MRFGVDCSVIVDYIDLLTLRTDLGDSVGFLGLEAFDELVHNIDKDNLKGESTSALFEDAQGIKSTSNPAKHSFSATKPRPMFPPPK